jgi:phosphoribosylaminoimidazole carboxylase PurE protein
MAEEIQVAVLIGSNSDREVVEPCMDKLEELGLKAEMVVRSAHRMPDKTRNYVRDAESRGARVFIAGAGMAAALPGYVASVTELPVIGIPVPTGLPDGMDALLAMVQMPPGIPVATVAVGRAGARNAAVLAAEIIGINDQEVRGRIKAMREEWRKD